AREVWREAHPPFRVGGKTGSLTGSNPRGRYEWFVGFAPLEAPEVVVAVLIVNGKYWRLKSSYLALKVMEEYLKRRGYVD
ncbi:penicillin-binding protein, partial [bacterium]